MLILPTLSVICLWISCIMLLHCLHCNFLGQGLKCLLLMLNNTPALKTDAKGPDQAATCDKFIQRTGCGSTIRSTCQCINKVISPKRPWFTVIWEQQRGDVCCFYKVWPCLQAMHLFVRLQATPTATPTFCQLMLRSRQLGTLKFQLLTLCWIVVSVCVHCDMRDSDLMSASSLATEQASPFNQQNSVEFHILLKLERNINDTNAYRFKLCFKMSTNIFLHSYHERWRPPCFMLLWHRVGQTGALKWYPNFQPGIPS